MIVIFLLVNIFAVYFPTVHRLQIYVSTFFSVIVCIIQFSGYYAIILYYNIFAPQLLFNMSRFILRINRIQLLTQNKYLSKLLLLRRI